MDVNYWGTVNALKAGALESVRTAGPRGTGRVLLVSSQAGQCGLYGYTGYAASKFALRGLAESLQQELLPSGIRVGMLFPPDTDTPQLQEGKASRVSLDPPPLFLSHAPALNWRPGPSCAHVVARLYLEACRRQQCFFG